MRKRKQEKSGIYKIINILNGRIYIGSTVNLKTRKATHFSLLKNGKHQNQFLQNDFNKCGNKAFVFEVITFVNKEELLIVEQQYIDQYFDNQTMCYNINKKAESRIGTKCSEKTKNILSKMFLNKSWVQLYGNNKAAKMKKALSHAMKGKPSKRLFGSENAFYGKRHTEKTKKKISKANKGRLVGKKNPMFGRCGKKHPFYGKTGSKHHASKKVIQYNPETGQQIKVFNSLCEAERHTQISNTTISRCCHGKQKTSGGWGWKFANKE